MKAKETRRAKVIKKLVRKAVADTLAGLKPEDVTWTWPSLWEKSRSGWKVYSASSQKVTNTNADPSNANKSI